MEQEVIITNHNQLFHFSDPSKRFTQEFTRRNFDQSETRLVLERDQAKSNFSNSICKSFFVVS